MPVYDGRATAKLPDIPSHLSALPNQEAAEARLTEFKDLYESTPGLNMDAELDKLRDDLQVIFHAPTPTPAP